MQELLVVVFCAVAILEQTEGRKYDIEEECRKIYGEDLNKMLKRFRRSSDYIKILNIKKNEIKSEFLDMITFIYVYEEKIMKEKIYSMYNLTAPTRRISQNYFGNKKRKHLESTPKSYGKAKSNKRTESDEYSLVELLENEVYNRLLSVKEANAFIDMGFEFAGRIFHKAIKNMDDDYSDKSTRLPIEDKYTFTHSTVTEHVHEVTSAAHPKSTHGDNGKDDGDETYFYRNSKPKLPNTELNN